MNSKKFKQYCLYLDESGDFEESEANLNSPSLVGGVFFQKESINEQAAEHIISQVRDKYVKKNEQYKAINYHHATELPVEIKADVKVDMVETIIENGFTPVIFQQQSKEKILNNTTTYIMFLVDGIVKLIQDYTYHNPMELTVTIGYRQNIDVKRKLASKGEINLKNDYIKPQEIKNEFDKYLTIAQIRETYNFRNKFKVNLKFAHDKDNLLLVLSDYICNFYYVKESFKYKKGLNLRVMKLINSNNKANINKFNTYSILEEPEIERLKRNIDDRNFGEALFFAMLINHQTREWDRFKPKLRKCFADISDAELQLVLANFYAKMQLLGTYSDKSHQTIQIVNNAIDFIGDKDILKSCYDSFMAHVNLFKMAALMHLGNYNQFLRVSEKCETHVKASRELNVYLMFANRMTVFYYANFQYLKSIEAGERLLRILEKLELEVNSIFQETGYRFDICGDQYEKICGSLALSCYGACSISKEYVEKGRKYSFAAIDGFQKEYNKRRSAQILAQIEAESGNFRNACEQLNYGLRINVEKLLEPDYSNGEKSLKKLNDFDWYHMSKLMATMISSSDIAASTLALKMLNDSLENFKEYVNKLDNQITFPTFITLCMFANCLINSPEVNRYKDYAITLFKKAISAAESPREYSEKAKKSSSPRFRAAGLIIRAFFLLALIKINNKNDFNNYLYALKEKMNDYLSSGDVANDMKNIFVNCKSMLDEVKFEDRERAINSLSILSRKILF